MTTGGFDNGFKRRCVKGYYDQHPDLNNYTDMTDDQYQSSSGKHYNISTEVELTSGTVFTPQVGMAGQAYPIGSRYAAVPTSPMMFDFTSGDHLAGYTAYLREDWNAFLPFANNAFHWIGLCEYQDKGSGTALGYTNTATTAITAAIAAPTNAAVTTAVMAVSVTAGGSGYTSAPAVAFTGGVVAAGGAAATAHATINGGVVTGVIVDTPGSYSTAPTGVTLTGGGGTGATAAFPIGGTGTGNFFRAITGLLFTYPVLTVASVAVTANGSGYTSAPAVAFTGGTGGGATAHATISGGAVTGVVMDTPGSYTVAPTGVSFTGGGGAGAAATLTTQIVPFFGAIDLNLYVAPGFPKDYIYVANAEPLVRACVQGTAPSWYGFASCDASYFAGLALTLNAAVATKSIVWSSVLNYLTTTIDQKVGSNGTVPNAASGTTYMPRPLNGASSIQIKGINYAIEANIPRPASKLILDYSISGMGTNY